MALWAEAIVYPEAVPYIWVNPAVISLLKDWTRELVWWLMPNNPDSEKYNTPRWFSDSEKQEIEEAIQVWDVREIQLFLSRYI